MTTTVTAQIQLRRDTAANWTSNDPILALGEIGYETDTLKQKMGDGTTAWSSLDYYYDPSGLVTNGDSHNHSGGDGAQIAYSGLSGLPTLGSAAATDSTAYEAAGSIATHAALTTTHGISSFGATLVDDSDAATARSTLGLGTAATTASTAYATATQGGKADTAVQPGGALGTPSSGTLTNCSGYPIPTVKLDDAGAPDDNTDLNATTSAHGLLPKLGGGTLNYLRADGTWSTPSGSGYVASDTHAATSKTTPVDADELPLADSAASYVLKKLTWSNLKATLQAVFAPFSLTLNDQTGTTYTLVLSDAGKLIRASNAAAITLTVPPNASVAFPTGTSIAVQQQGVGQVSIAAGAGVTINSRSSMSKISDRYGGVSLVKTASDTWWLEGALSL